MGKLENEYNPSASPNYEASTSGPPENIPDEIHPSNHAAILDNGLPGYTQNDPHGIQSIIQSASTGTIDLPIKSFPCNQRETSADQLELCQDIVNSFFSAITSKKDEAVAMMIESNLVTANTTSQWGETPLLAAVRIGNVHMAQELLDFDADVNGFGKTASLDEAARWGSSSSWAASQAAKKAVRRTPLMLAAAMGNLNLVKLFVEVYHADDALIAPDGELALRLASDHGHREIVVFLPSRRGGGWRRWKTKHANAMKRAERAVQGIYSFFKVLLYEIPRFIVWSCPKHLIVLPLKYCVVWCWKHRGEFGGWCKQQAKEMPGRISRGAAKVWRGIRKVPVKIWNVVKEVPKAVKEVSKWVWSIIKALPNAFKVIALWVWHGIRSIAHGVGNIFSHLASFLHTAFSAIISFFRHITLKDIWNGFRSFLRAIFLDFPVKIWRWIERFGDMSYKVLKAVFGELGEVVWWIGALLIHLVAYVPTKVWEVLVSCGGSIRKAWIELLVWINPKR